MIKTFFLLLILLASFLYGFSGTNAFSNGTRAASLSNAAITLHDAFSIFSNQAGIASVKNVTIACAAESMFVKTGINALNALLIVPARSGNFGLSVQYYGFQLYNENKIGLTYARLLGSKLSIGVQMDYWGFHISGNSDVHKLTFEAGLQYQLLKELRLGVHVFNPIQLRIQKVNIGNDQTLEEFLPTSFAAGLGYQPSAKVLLTAQVSMHTNSKPGFSSGLEYHVTKLLALRAGIVSQPTSASFGMGLKLKSVLIDLSSAYHPVLGYTPGIGITYQFHKANEESK